MESYGVLPLLPLKFTIVVKVCASAPIAVARQRRTNTRTLFHAQDLFITLLRINRARPLPFPAAHRIVTPHCHASHASSQQSFWTLAIRPAKPRHYGCISVAVSGRRRCPAGPRRLR